MGKLCARGKAAAKRKFKVYPAAAAEMEMAQQAADLQSTEAQTAATLDPQVGGEQETAAPEGGEI